MAELSHAVTDGAIHPVLTLVNGKPTTTSLEVAAFFGKEHKNVLRDIAALLRQLPAERRLSFEPTSRNVAGGNGAIRREHFYILTFNGFVLLAMGYTGPKALRIKLAYMDEFDRMEALGREQLAQQLALADGTARQLQSALAGASGAAAAYEGELKQTQAELIASQRDQIRLLRRVAGLQHRHSRREATRLAVDMKRRGEPNERIEQATGLNNNHIRRIVFRARRAGDLPPPPEAIAAQATLDLGVQHG